MADEEVKKDAAHQSIDGHNSSQDSDGHDHDEMLEKVFGVMKEKNGSENEAESINFLTEYRRKEAEWRRQNFA